MQQARQPALGPADGGSGEIERRPRRGIAEHNEVFGDLHLACEPVGLSLQPGDPVGINPPEALGEVGGGGELGHHVIEISLRYEKGGPCLGGLGQGSRDPE
jgi:hypothetical protein